MEIEPVNVVAGGNLNREVDIQALCSELASIEDVSVDFTDENRWQLVIKFEDAGKVLLYRTGSYIIRGGSDHDSLDRTKNSWFELLKREDIIENMSSVEYEVQNIVYSADIDQDIDLAFLTIQLGAGCTEYEPEQFPGLIYRPEAYSVVVLVFSSGKAIVTGGTDQKEAESVLRYVREKSQIT